MPSGRKNAELAPVEAEMLKKAVSAPGRCGDQLETARHQLQVAEVVLNRCLQETSDAAPEEPSGDRRVPGDSARPAFSNAIDRYREAWRETEQAPYRYIVHREGVGPRCHEFVEKIYPKQPPKIKIHRA